LNKTTSKSIYNQKRHVVQPTCSSTKPK